MGNLRPRALGRCARRGKVHTPKPSSLAPRGQQARSCTASKCPSLRLTKFIDLVIGGPLNRIKLQLTGAFPPTEHDIALLEQYLCHAFFDSNAYITISNDGRIIQCLMTPWNLLSSTPTGTTLVFHVDRLLRGRRYWGGGTPSLSSMVIEVTHTSTALANRYHAIPRSSLCLIPSNRDLRDRSD